MTVQKNPLLSFRVKCNGTEPAIDNVIKYNMISGMWLDSSGQPVIEKYITDKIASHDDKTTITATRESIDRAEGSHHVSENFFGETLITKTREGIDRSEGSIYLRPEDEPLRFESIETRTREGIDRAESSFDFITDEECSSEANMICANAGPCFETTQTYTRESIDRSESSH